MYEWWIEAISGSQVEQVWLQSFKNPVDLRGIYQIQHNMRIGGTIFFLFSCSTHFLQFGIDFFSYNEKSKHRMTSEYFENIQLKIMVNKKVPECLP